MGSQQIRREETEMPRTVSRRDSTPRYSDADLEPLLRTLAAVRDGDFRASVAVEADGAVAEAAMLLEEIRERGARVVGGLAQVRRQIGTEGDLRERLPTGDMKGSSASAVADP